MQTVSLLGICASPRENGNSQYLLEHALAGADAVEAGRVASDVWSFARKEIGPCISCFRCEELGDCAIRDDFQELRDAWMAADAIVYSVPVYHMGIPKLLKVVGVVVQGDCIFSGQEQVMIALVNHAVLMGCIPVAGDPWQSYLGAAGWTRQDLGEDSLRNLYESGEADAKVAVAAAKSLGKRVAQTALLIKGGGAACRDMLAADGAYGLFLSRLQSRDPRPG